MKLSKKLSFLLVSFLIVWTVILLALNKGGIKNMGDGNASSNTGLQVISPVFREGGEIPIQYSCKGQNVSPPLNFMNIPAGTQSLALIVHDPDAPVGDYVHWAMWDIPTSTETIAANSVPAGAIQGKNSNDENKYMGPCPPSGTHRYMFELYALDKTLGLPAETTRDQLKDAMKGHIIKQHTLTATFSATQE